MTGSHGCIAVTEVQIPGITEVVSSLLPASIPGPIAYSKEPQLTHESKSSLLGSTHSSGTHSLKELAVVFITAHSMARSCPLGGPSPSSHAPCMCASRPLRLSLQHLCDHPFTSFKTLLRVPFFSEAVPVWHREYCLNVEGATISVEHTNMPTLKFRPDMFLDSSV